MNDKPNNTPDSDTPAEDSAAATPELKITEASSQPEANTDAPTTATEAETDTEENPTPAEPAAATTEATEATEAIIVSEPQSASETIDVIEVPTNTTKPASPPPKTSKKGFWLLGTLIVVAQLMVALA